MRGGRVERQGDEVEQPHPDYGRSIGVAQNLLENPCLATTTRRAKDITATDETILMKDGKGACATIEFKSPDQPNEGLG